jgi:hypothetical protein
MPDVSGSSPRAQRRRDAWWGAIALLVAVAVMDAARLNWIGAAQMATLACMVALLPSALAGSPTKVQQARNVFVLLLALALQIWQYVAQRAP